MPAKKVSLGRKPEKPEAPTDLEEWVTSRENVQTEQPKENQTVRLKRLTLDIPEDLHRAIKRQALESGVTMADLLRSLLSQHYGS